MECPLALSSRKPSLISLGLGFRSPYSALPSHTFVSSWLLCLEVSPPSWRGGICTSSSLMVDGTLSEHQERSHLFTEQEVKAQRICVSCSGSHKAKRKIKTQPRLH